jgi:hypothetical protein
MAGNVTGRFGRQRSWQRKSSRLRRTLRAQAQSRQDLLHSLFGPEASVPPPASLFVIDDLIKSREANRKDGIERSYRRSARGFAVHPRFAPAIQPEHAMVCNVIGILLPLMADSPDAGFMPD